MLLKIAILALLATASADKPVVKKADPSAADLKSAVAADLQTSESQKVIIKEVLPKKSQKADERADVVDVISEKSDIYEAPSASSVSYTHLTLPTILLV